LFKLRCMVRHQSASDSGTRSGVSLGFLPSEMTGDGLDSPL
jgi:hypothetical protein